MATFPGPVTTGDLVSAADWNSIEDYVAPTGRRMSRTTVQNIPDATTTQVSYNNIDITEGSISFSGGVFTVGRVGVYQMSAGSRWEDNATGYRRMTIRVNGTPVAGSVIRPESGGAVSYQTASTEYPLAVSDEIDVQVLQTSGGTLALLGLAATFFSCWHLTGTE